MDSVPGKGLLPDSRPHLLAVFPCGRKGKLGLLGDSSLGLECGCQSHSCPKHFPKAPSPNIVTLGVRIQHMNLLGSTETIRLWAQVQLESGVFGMVDTPRPR